MEHLRIEFDNGNLRGSGTDIIGPFAMTGTIEEGDVAIIKQYLGQHGVDYLGTYDGEGTTQGLWRIGWFLATATSRKLNLTYNWLVGRAKVNKLSSSGKC
jgi:hypothetical protein